MGTTANRLYPYPDPGDPADFPSGMQALAEAVDIDVQALVNSLTPVPFCVVSGDDAQSTVPGFTGNLAYDTVNFDSGGIADLGADNAGLTPPEAGLYFIHGSARVPDVTTRLEMFLRVGATAIDFGRMLHQGNAPATPRLFVSGLASLSGTDRVRVTFEQNTGTLQNIFSRRLAVYKIA